MARRERIGWLRRELVRVGWLIREGVVRVYIVGGGTVDGLGMVRADRYGVAISAVLADFNKDLASLLTRVGDRVPCLAKARSDSLGGVNCGLPKPLIVEEGMFIPDLNLDLTVVAD